MKPIIITVSGKSGSGKDEFARYLKEYLVNNSKNSNNVLIIHQADYLKWICEKYLRVFDDKSNEAVRTAWQTVGTDLFRKDDPFYWVRTLEYNISILERYANWEYVIIPDCRFRNEISYFEDMGYNVNKVYVSRPDEKSKLTYSQQSHVSENSLTENDKFDYKIKARTLTALSYNAREVGKEILKENE